MGKRYPAVAIALLCCLVLLTERPAAAAAERQPGAQPESRPESPETEVQGVLINQTRSAAGQAFYAGFFTVWAARDQEGLYSLVITEKPSPQNAGASHITVSYENVPVFSRTIAFNVGKARAVGEAATEYVFNRIIEVEVGREVENPDLAASGY